MNWKASTVLFLASQCISSLSDFLFERKIQEMAFRGGTHLASLRRRGDGRECVWDRPLWPENLCSVLGLTSVCRLCVSRWEHLPTAPEISPLLCHVPCSTRKRCCTLQVTPEPRRAGPAVHAFKSEEHCSGFLSKHLRQLGSVPRLEGVALKLDGSFSAGRGGGGVSVTRWWGGVLGCRVARGRGVPLRAWVQWSDFKWGVSCRTSLVVQWVRILCLLKQRTEFSPWSGRLGSTTRETTAMQSLPMITGESLHTAPKTHHSQK